MTYPAIESSAIVPKPMALDAGFLGPLSLLTIAVKLYIDLKNSAAALG